MSKNTNHDDNLKKPTNEETTHRSRRANKSKSKGKFSILNVKDKLSAVTSKDGGDGTKAIDLKNLDKKKIFKIGLCAFLAICLIGVIYAAVVIITAPDIETDNIYSLLSQSSVLYDDDGEVMDSVFGDQNRTLAEIGQIPDHVQKAFIALEDKTFESHNGFNIIRIFGAMKDAVFNGGRISGTSTITQQLSRNLYLTDEMFDRDMGRKIREAYYAVILEKELSKDEILEAYLNTINFGCGYGIQTASQAYFSKDVSELTIPEAAALAALPQAPSTYALVVAKDINEITEDTPNLILKSGDTAYVWNDACKDRMQTCLYLMNDQGYITDKEYEEALKVEIKDIVNPNLDALNTVSNYFADYAIQTVLNDLQEEAGYSYEEAYNLVYNGGIKIYTTMDSQAQSVIDKEFAVDSNFPSATGYSKDSAGNILDDNGKILLYDYKNYINDSGNFVLTSDEFTKNSDGSLTLFTGKRLNFYTTTVQGETDYSVEFKNMYVYDGDSLYSINGGYINIPQQYKSRDKDDNIVISADFFKDYPTFFVEEGSGLATNQFTLNPRTIQPQAAMTIIDNSNGQIKAMTGGRKTTGRQLFNRAISPQQPGSSIKPLAVYSAALQKSYELQQAGDTFYFTDGLGEQGSEGWGNYLTAASIVDDEPLTINGKVWPKNSYSGYSGLYTFRTALQQSVNVCAVKILSQVGVDYSADLVEKFGISTLDDTNDLNLAALGMGGMTQGASTLEMANAYTTFVNGGNRHDYSIYTKVTTRNGDLLLEPTVEEHEVLDPGVAWIMRDCLRSNVTEGIGSPASISGAAVGGKTGTTDDKFDIWFCGFTPTYSAALWIGNDVNIALSSYSNMAASLWGNIMGQINGSYGGSYSGAPSNVTSATIDTKSGLLATDASGSNTRTEYFTTGTVPTESDTSHQSADICLESGYLATPSCSSVEHKSGIVRPYVPNPKVGDIKNELPHYYCNEHNPNPDAYPAEPGKPVTIIKTPTVVPQAPQTPETPPSAGTSENSGSGTTSSSKPATQPKPNNSGSGSSSSSSSSGSSSSGGSSSGSSGSGGSSSGGSSSGGSVQVPLTTDQHGQAEIGTNTCTRTYN